MNQKRLIDYLEEKAKDNDTKNKICIEILDDDGSYYSITYSDFYDMTKKFIKVLSDNYDDYEKIFNQYNCFPLLLSKINPTPLISMFIASLTLNYHPLLSTFEIIYRNNSYGIDKAMNGDFYFYSSGTTGLLSKPKPASEQHIIKSVVKNFINDYHIENEKFYSTISMTGIAGVTMSLFFPIITPNSVCISDNTNFFENIYKTKATMFILPLNYRDFLPIKDSECNDYSHVKYIMISGGYFNSKDINHLLTNLPGLKKESIIYMYSSTELEGNSISNFAPDIKSISLSMPELIKGNIVFKTGMDSIEYLSSGVVDSKSCQIVDNNKQQLKEDQLGYIKINDNISEDLGIIHQNKLYVIGRKQDNDKYNLSILNNYFRYQLDNDVSCGLYNNELIVFCDIIDNYFGFEIKHNNTPSFRKGIYQGTMNNFKLRDKANELIKYLEDNYNYEFYGDSILVKFERNGRLEKILFNYKEYDPFDNNLTNIKGAKLFDLYYYINYNFISLFIGALLSALNIYNNTKDEYSIRRNYEDIYDMFKELYENKELFNKIKNDPMVKQAFTCIQIKLVNHLYTSLDSLNNCKLLRDEHLSMDNIKSFFGRILCHYKEEDKEKIRELYCIVLELLYNIGITIDYRKYTAQELFDLDFYDYINYFGYIRDKILKEKNKAYIKK